ncbi:hypothetical protein L1987_42097 [Smallanthus sonchifolius]|uniref:Uncharacterized protein n=1 Tax=Smallanthus sonchifolius TaxID=185202 RepID=A0ACB9GWT0_9ASTR|nr:hypothetical protein L1987_42097 [Smallanthus sonchifolius]
MWLVHLDVLRSAMATLAFSTSSLHPKTLTKKTPSHSPSQTLIHLPKSPNFQFPTSVINHKTLIAPPIRSTTTTTISDTHAPQTLKSRLKNGDTLYGLFLLSFSPTLAEIAGLSGYDFVVVDMEHGPGGISQALSCLHALAAARTPAILRLPDSDAAWAKKALDLGPQGIMFPMIESQKMAKKAVSYCKFPPNGVRGSAHTVVRASDYGIDNGYLSSYEDELLIMCQVESEEGVKKIEEIASVDGVDCVQMGPLDLSASMGYLWDPGNKKVKEMLRTAEKGVLKTTGKGGGGAYLSGFAMPHDRPEDMRSRGYHMISGAVDIGLFRSACVEDVKRFKSIASDDEDNDKDKDGDEKYWSE